MLKIIFAFSMYSCGAIAAEVHQLPVSPTEQAIQLARSYLAEPNHIKALQHWKALVALEVGGLVFTDRVLAMITEDESPWRLAGDRRTRLLNRAVTMLEEPSYWINFDKSSLKKSIHENAQKVLERSRLSAPFTTDIVNLYNLLKLWDETDLPTIISLYYLDRSYAPVLIRHFARGSPEVQKRFATRVRKSHRYELVEVGLLYQVQLLRDDEMIWVFRRLLEHSYYKGMFQQNQLDLYENDARVVEKFRNKLVEHLHERLRSRDPLVTQIFNTVRENPGWDGHILTRAKRAAYNTLLRELWTGRPNGTCHVYLVEDALPTLPPSMADELE